MARIQAARYVQPWFLVMVLGELSEWIKAITQAWPYYTCHFW